MHYRYYPPLIYPYRHSLRFVLILLILPSGGSMCHGIIRGITHYSGILVRPPAIPLSTFLVVQQPQAKPSTMKLKNTYKIRRPQLRCCHLFTLSQSLLMPMPRSATNRFILLIASYFDIILRIACPHLIHLFTQRQ